MAETYMLQVHHTQIPNAYSHCIRKQNFAYMAYLRLAFVMMKVQLIPKHGPKRTQLCVCVCVRV